MDLYSGHINRLIDELSSLPGIGGKSAQRLAFYIINLPKDRVHKLADAITNARENVHYCKICCTLTDDDICPICGNTYTVTSGSQKYCKDCMKKQQQASKGKPSAESTDAAESGKQTIKTGSAAVPA